MADLDGQKYKNLTDSIADLMKRENDLLQKASQADAGSEGRKRLVEQLYETTNALQIIEAQRREMVKAVGKP